MRRQRDAFAIDRETVDQWTAWLACWDWRVFGTFTFAEDRLPADLARSRWDAWRVAVDAYTFGVAGRALGLGWTWALALEYQKRGSPHYHALGGSASAALGRVLDVVSRRAMRDLWADGRRERGEAWIRRERVEGQGWARIEAIRGSGAVCAYAAKYAVKAGTVEIVRPTPAEPLAGHARKLTGTLRDLQDWAAMLPTGATESASGRRAASDVGAALSL